MSDKTIDDLKGNPQNPRTMSVHDANALKKSMGEFGDLSSIVFNRQTGQLVGGHQRVETLKRLGGTNRVQITQTFNPATDDGTIALGYITYNKKAFPYREVDWPYEREMAANIAANRIQGEFDLDLLGEATVMLREADAELLALTGQSEDEINDLLKAAGVISDEVVEDETPDVDNSKPPESELGKIYQLGRHRVMCGDSTDRSSVDLLMNGEKADMAITDPPYGINIVQNKSVGGGKLAKVTEYRPIENDNDVEVAHKAINIMKETTLNQIVFGGNYFADRLEPKMCWIVWDKDNTGNFADCELAWSSYDKAAKLYKVTWNGMIREGESGQRVHPTQKPLKLFDYIIKDFEPNSVQDLFLGSGSTLIACEQTDRTCYGMELDPRYVDVIRKRYAQFVAGDNQIPENWQELTPAVG